MSSLVGVLIELAVVVLLGFTVAYCIILDRRLQRLRADEKSMRQTVVDLGLATDRAERSIDALRQGITEWESTIGARVRAAETSNDRLLETIQAGDDVLDRISRIVTGARKAMVDIETHQAPVIAANVPPTPMTSTVAAAEAFASRARQRILQQAA
jgi:Domain of unknown function (DUF6468)